ncbi:BamA/TamA family outer membrane protein [Ichthyenterobacterium sp. W332]|uniref:BamA/TamA family outer membrane protein n=1 Tax=Microcosmobacter mediterraneus TaxID=3075607 RepID=A0ABU2YNU7_9FLAO|nr:BamA/TamA family outer membrane protein [Ichthyenterobacterium sp. W332]MDT0559364.1 BamA/TamA family outer membrane protein [Ichthyenterobacterium sp. W332]
MKHHIKYILQLICICFLVLSCNVIKRVKKDDYLLTENTVYIDGKKEKSEDINNLIYQKPNSKIPLLGTPVRLHVFNLARPNIDSIMKERIYGNPKKLKRKTKLLSKKQLDRLIYSRGKLNSWLKRTGEAPVIVNEEKSKKSATQLRKYFFDRGWFETKTDYTINYNDKQRATVHYTIIKGKPYILDSIVKDIKSPIIDSLYSKIKTGSLLKTGDQYKNSNFTKERERINTFMRNQGVYHFAQDYITFDIDTFGLTKTVNTKLNIANRAIRTSDSTVRVPFKQYTIRDVTIITDARFENQNNPLTDSISYNDYKLYSYNKLAYRPKAITDAIFISKGKFFSDLDRTRTYRYLNELQTFNAPDIRYIEHDEDSTLTALIQLSPRKKYDLGIEANISQSNIQTVGFSGSIGLITRNIFKGAETLEISAIGTIGASKDGNNPDDPFFDINELGATAKLTIPRMFFPFNTERIIPKYMSPTTRINLAATSQTNIGLDKQTFSGALSYNWYPNDKVTNTLDLFDVQYVKNLNTNNYFNVYNTSYDRLVDIARDINYINQNDVLTIPNGADMFIDDVLNLNTSIGSTDPNFFTINSINQRQDRLTEDNLIFASSFNYVKDKKESLFDNDYSTFKMRFELAGNLLANVSNIFNLEKNQNDQYEIFGVAFSQYAKAEFDYIKYWDLGRNSVFAMRSYLGIAVPYGNSNNIPFAKSFFAGGPNDNRAWTAYNLGPGSSITANEFNEANLKIHLSFEQRFNIFGSFKGALFLDAGNIWNVLDNVEDDAATFKNFNSLQDIAIGSGLGLRYDFRFFIVRFDVGFKTYDPSYELGNRWFNDYNFRNAVYNIGINYPF